MIKPLTYPGFEDPAISYGFFGRNGGVSDGLFGSLNLKRGTGDDDQAVSENFIRVCEALGADEDQLTYITQIHGDVCHRTNSVLDPDIGGDAIVTSKPGLAIGILTADCAPILLIGKKADGAAVVGAAHAGWGGALKGIIESTVDGMVAEGATLNSIKAAVGPCITEQNYEVSIGFELPFLDEDKASAVFFKSLPDGRQSFDLPGYVAFRLKRAGVGSVIVGGEDTYSEDKQWFSHRRASHRGQDQGGRQISAICIRNS